MDERYDVRVAIESESGGETIRQSAEGTLYRKRTGWYLRYEEAGEDGARTTTLIKFGSEEWTVRRSGAADSHLVFVLTIPRAGYYRISGIELPVITTMRSRHIELDRGQGTATWSYDLQLEAGQSEYHRVVLRIF